MRVYLDIDIVHVPIRASFGMGTLGSCCPSFDTALKPSRYKSAILKLAMPMSQLISPLTGAIDVGRQCKRVKVVSCMSSQNQDCMF